MANPFRDMSVIMQGLVAAAIAVIVVLVGLFLPFSPVAQERDQVDQAVKERSQLNQEVQQLSLYKQRYSELKQQMDALNKQPGTTVSGVFTATTYFTKPADAAPSTAAAKPAGKN